MEPFAPSVIERINCIKLLSHENIKVVVRLQPLIFTWIENIKDNLIPLISEMGCKHVIVEFLKLPVEERLHYLILC